MRSLIFIFIIFSGLILFVLAMRAHKNSGIIDIDKGGVKPDIFKIAACYLYQKVCVRILLKYLKGSLFEYLFQAPQVKKDLRALKPGEKAEALQAEYYVNKIKYFLILFYVGVILGFCVYIANAGDGEIRSNSYVERNAYGEGEKQVDVQVITKDGQYESTLRLNIDEAKLTEAEISQLYEKAVKELEGMVWGSNNGKHEIYESLKLPNVLEGYPFELEWESNKYFLINHHGQIQKQDIDANGERVTLTCHFSYGKWQHDYDMSAVVFPERRTEEQIWEKRLWEALNQTEQEYEYDSRYILPQIVDRNEVLWVETRHDYSMVIFALMLLAACIVYIMQDKDLHKKFKERNEEMLIEYPVLINRLTLYMGAGMTIKGAWNKIAKDYAETKQNTNKIKYAYEEMLFTCYEMQCGISEFNAYERFGKRCGIQIYTRMVGLLCQSMKKGNIALLNDLQKEADAAQELRRNMARKKGEEAGTKLLVPMMMMLGIVMILIMVPAFYNF